MEDVASGSIDMPFTVIVADNFHYMDESENYRLGDFGTLEEAVDTSRRIVDEYLASAYTPGMTAAALYDSYVNFGEDPYILSNDVKGIIFSAWTYARERCESICGPTHERR
jgi:hypothetical protein